MIQLNFNRAAHSYEENSPIQQQMAQKLLQSINSLELSSHSCTEYGCGTGYLSRHLLQLFPNGQFCFCDLSPAMLEWSKAHLSETRQGQISWIQGDLRTHTPNPATDLILSNATLQWIPELPEWLHKIHSEVNSGTVIGFSLFGPKNLWEIYTSYHRALGRPLSNPIHLREAQALIQTAQEMGWNLLECQEYSLRQKEKDLLALLRNFRATGVSPSQGRKALSKTELSLWTEDYLEHYSEQGQVHCSWDCFHLILRKI